MAANVLEELKLGSHLFPIPCYWLDLNQHYLGVNPLILEITGTTSYEKDFLGKTPYDFYPSETAHNIIQLHKKALETKKTVSLDESIRNAKTGEIRRFRITIAPLRDNQMNILGTIASLFDMTMREEAERLKIESHASETELKEEKENYPYITKYTHKIYSPLAALLACYHQYYFVKEERIRLQKQINFIVDIIYDLFKNDEDKSNLVKEDNEVLISLLLMDVIREKRFACKDRPWIELTLDINQDAYFCFVRLSLDTVRQELSKLIDIPLASARKNPCVINVELKNSNNEAAVVLHCEGIEISPKRVRTLQGTMVSVPPPKLPLFFPCSAPPDWVATNLILYQDDILVILDSDASMHNIWRCQLASISSSIQVKYFKDSKEAIRFIETVENKEKLFLLSKFELGPDEQNGLTIIEKLKLKRSILVTSYYCNKIIRERASQIHLRILPVILTFLISIDVRKEVGHYTPVDSSAENIELHLIKRIEQGLTDFHISISNNEAFLKEPYHNLLFGVFADQREVEIDKKKGEWDEIEFTVSRLDQSALIHGSSTSLDIDKTMVRNSIAEIRNRYKQDLLTIKTSEMIFEGFAKKEILLKCNISDCLSAVTVKDKFNANKLKYKVNIRSKFRFIGNTIVVDYIIRVLLKYLSVKSIIKDEENTFFYTNENVHYNLLVIEGVTEDMLFSELDQFTQSSSFMFCQHLMRAFGGLISAEIRDINHLVFILAFPKVIVHKRGEDYIMRLKRAASQVISQ